MIRLGFRVRFVAALFVSLCSASFALAEEEWQTLFNGKDLTGWRANVMPEAFTVVDGAIRAHAPKESAHLFFTGDAKEGFVRFKDFEFEVTCRGEAGANSGIFFHTDLTTRDKALHLGKGYEVQLNSSEKEKRKTGSLYAVVDLDKSPVDESEWFRVRIVVKGSRITVSVNDKQVVDYTEPPDVKRPAERAGRLLDKKDGGGIPLQAHDPKSVFYFKDVRVRRLE